MSHLSQEPSHPATQHIILKIVGFKNSHKTEHKLTKTFSVPPPPAFCGLQEQLFAYLLPKREKRGEQLRSQNTMTRWGGLAKDTKLLNNWVFQ